MGKPVDMTYDFKSWSDVSYPGVAVAFMVIGVLYLIREAYRTNFPKIKNIPEVPNPLPFVGHLNQLGGRQPMNDPSVFTKWGEQLNSGIIQARLGDQRTVIVNDYKIIEDLWVGMNNHLADRPDQPGFVEKLGVDVTGFPMTPQLRKCRAAAMKALAKPMWPRYYPLIEPSSAKLVSDLYQQGKNGLKPVQSYWHLRHLVFDLTLSLTYGARFGEVRNEFMDTFIRSINDVSAVRNSTHSYRHFVPLLRLIPESTNKTIQAEKVRAKHLSVLYQAFLDRKDSGADVDDCIVASLGKDKLTLEEIHGVCVSLLQAAPDTVASGLYQGLAWLSSSEEGAAVQKECYDAIMEAYNGDRDAAWTLAFREEKVPIITSMYKEILRFYTVSPYAVPRRTSKDVQYKDIFIPKGVTIIMNAQEANHQTKQFGNDAASFNAKRYIGDEKSLPHMTFGAGARICPAVAISNRIMYAMLQRIILAFEVRPVAEGEGRRPTLDHINFSDVRGELVMAPRHYEAKYVARDEEWLQRVTREGIAAA